MENELRTGPWNLKDLETVTKNGQSVFSIFHCGGGSSMGYKLAGFDVIGGVEIDPKMMAIYKANHNPKHSYLMGVEEFNKIPNDQLPKELFELDILDGSPPCSSFSTAGSREKNWGKKTHFREGQTEQILDDLFFHFIDTAKKLKPKVVIAENVSGLIKGNARGYVKQIFAALREAGYSAQLFLLNASRMGVPQARERTFFIANRINAPKLKLEFNEEPISISKVVEQSQLNGKKINEKKLESIYNKVAPGQDFRDIAEKVYGRRSVLAQKINRFKPLHTQTVSRRLVSDLGCYEISDITVIRGQSFPDDYNFKNLDQVYLCGMSVPPFMMQRVADEVYKQWLRHTAHST